MNLKNFLAIGIPLIWNLAIIPKASALDPSKQLHQYIHQNWTVKDGLPLDAIGEVVQTADGYIWLGTYLGLVRFDGAKFEPFLSKDFPEFNSTEVTGIAEDKNRVLWLITKSNKLIRYEAGEFHYVKDNQGNPVQQVSHLAKDEQGTIYIQKASQLFKVRNRQLELLLSCKQQPCSFSILADSSIWVAYKGEIAELNFAGDHIRGFTTKHGLPDNRLRRIFLDSNNRLWVTGAQGVFYLQDNRFVSIKDLTQNNVTSIFEDNDGSIWIGTRLSGMFRLAGNRLSHFTKDNGLPDDQILSLFEDREGNLWVGMFAGGVSRYSDCTITTYTTLDGLPDIATWGLLEDSHNTLWISTIKRLAKFENNAIRAIEKPEWSEIGGVISIASARNGDLLVGTTHNGLFRLSKDKAIRLGNLGTQYIFDLYEDNNERIWIATEMSIFRYSEGRLELFTPKAESMISNNCIVADKQGRLWIARSEGVYVLDSDKPVQGLQKIDAFSNIETLSVFLDETGAMWFGTIGSGLFFRLKGKYHLLSSAHGLPSDVVYSVVADTNQDIWLGTAAGIVHLRREELLEFADQKRTQVNAKVYGMDHGLKKKGCNGGAGKCGIKTQDGRLWFSTSGGLSMIDPKKIETNKRPPPVVVQKVLVDGKKIRSQTLIPPGSERIEFQYAGLSYTDPKAVRYKYRLHGYDEQWIEAGTERFTRYMNLPPGEYRFQVIACNNSGIWNDKGASFAFVQEPFFYQTGWFMVLVVLGFVSLSGGISYYVPRYRLRKLQKQKEHLEQQVAERTREIRRQAEELARTNLELEKLSIVARETDNAVIIMDAETRFEWVNEGFERMFGINLEQLIMQKGNNLVEASAQPQIRNIINMCLEKKEMVTYESTNSTATGERIHTQTTLSPMLNDQGELIKLIAIDADITDLKKAQQQALEHAHKAGMADVAINTVHQVGNTLSSVKTEINFIRNSMKGKALDKYRKANQLLKDNLDNLESFVCHNPKGKSLMEYYLNLESVMDVERKEALNNVNQLENLVENISNVVRKQSQYTDSVGQFVEEVSLNQLVDNAIDTVKTDLDKMNIELKKSLPDDEIVSVQKLKLTQVIKELLVNAIEALKEIPTNRRTLIVSSKLVDDKVQITVQDTGCGISDENLARIFFHGFTTKKEHKGFGLHSCANNLSEMGGTIKVRSSGKGQGASFVVEFPV